MPLAPIIIAATAILLALLLKRKGHDTGGLSVAKASKWFAIAAAIALLVWYGPYFLGGYGWGYIGTGHASWSMSSDDGIMPGSLTLHKAYPTYEVGDDVSFNYRGSKEPSENGKSVKRVVAINPDGTYRVEGLSSLNTIPPYDVPEKDIIGKIVFHNSFLPESYWRWLSMGWTLEQEEIAERYHRIFSVETIAGVFTAQGRFRNKVALFWPPSEVARSEDGRTYVFNSGSRLMVYRDMKPIRRIDGEVKSIRAFEGTVFSDHDIAEYVWLVREQGTVQ